MTVRYGVWTVWTRTCLSTAFGLRFSRMRGYRPSSSTGSAAASTRTPSPAPRSAGATESIPAGAVIVTGYPGRNGDRIHMQIAAAAPDGAPAPCASPPPRRAPGKSAGFLRAGARSRLSWTGSPRVALHRQVLWLFSTASPSCAYRPAQPLHVRLRRGIAGGLGRSESRPESLEEDAPDDEALDEIPDADDIRALELQAQAVEEQGKIDSLLERIAALPPDSKLARLVENLDELTRDGYAQVMVFTQDTDTMDFLRRALRERGYRLLCFSGRGGESPIGNHDEWRVIDREQVKRRFRDGDADLLLCTDAAAEGLNFQFCGALVNYDMPWNPMRVEQRIGRIDRVGQRHATIRVVKLQTVETTVYGALRDRIGLFEQVVGRLQPILARMPREIADAVLAGGGNPNAPNIADRIKRQVFEDEQSGFDIDAALDTDLGMPDRVPSPVTLDDLDRVIRDPGSDAAGHRGAAAETARVQPAGARHGRARPRDH